MAELTPDCSYIECYDAAVFEVLAGQQRRVVCNRHVDALLAVIEDYKQLGYFRGPTVILRLA